MTYPSQGFLQKFLSDYRTRDVASPFLYASIFFVAEFFSCCANEWTRIDSIQLLLLVESDASNIYDFKPLLDFRFCAFTNVCKQLRVLNEFSFFIIQGIDFIWVTIFHDRELTYQISAKTCDALLSVKNLQASIRKFIEIEQS